ncbi:MAG: ribonuclease R [Oscillospiraceae bacterium]
MSLKSDLFKELKKGPKTAKRLRTKLDVSPKKLAKLLDRLVAEKKLAFREGQYALPQAGQLSVAVEGKLVKLAGRFGFVAPTDGTDDIFIPGHGLNGAMYGDVVKVVLFDQPRVPGSREGEIVEIVAPQNTVAGTVREEGGRLVLVPDNAPDVPLAIRRGADSGVKPGEKAAGQILERGEDYAEHQVGIVQRFGLADSARQCAKAILYTAGITKAFSEKVKNEAKVAASAKILKEELKRREDLREEVIFTIDSDATKDIDDAVSASRTKSGYRLGVHIADVSYYVKGKTVLDEEAFARGTSVYYADSVVAMLPRSLSNGACSLNPQEDRLAFSCLMELDGDARLVDYRFTKSLICSRVKGVYSEINTIFAGQESGEVREKYAEVRESLDVMAEIYHKLAKLRKARGSLEIESDEPKLVLNRDGVCVGVEKRERGDAERLIEEFMLLANTAAARFGTERKLPFLYRVHEKPPLDKAEQLKAVLTAVGVPFDFAGELPTTGELGQLLDLTRGKPVEIPVHTAVLRSMAKAVYSPQPQGHFGLALEDYSHFTSPIRRYPDLAIHRIMSDALDGMPKDQLQKRYKRFVQDAAVQSSEQEQLAQRVERDCDDCYKAEYMKPFVGQHFDGVITSVTPFGIYVGLPNTIEGLLRMQDLSEHRLEVQKGVALMDPVSKRRFAIGDTIGVKLAGVDISRGHIDFVLDE